MSAASNKDKMHVAREGILASYDKLGSQWIKDNPLFFMAIHDSDLYESEFAKKLAGLFKSTTTLHNFAVSLIKIDEDYANAGRFKTLLESSDEFRRKFYTFFVRLFCALIENQWNTTVGFNATYSAKSDLVSSITMTTFSTKDICANYITQSDVTKLVDALLKNKSSLKTHCRNMNSGYDRTLPGSGNTTFAHKATFRYDQMWTY